MPQTRSRIVPVLLAAVLLVGAANLGAYAANGGPLLLGKSNTASKTTKLKTTGNGAALSLKSKATAPPLKVSSSTTVAKLSADLVDGLDSSALRNRTYVFNLNASGITQNHAVFTLNGLPPGRYLVDLNVVASIGGSPTGASCFLVTGSGPSAIAPVMVQGSPSFGGTWFMNGGGYVDTTSATYRLTCQRVDGSAPINIPANLQYPATIAFTRVDDVSSATLTGAGSPDFRQGPG